MSANCNSDRTDDPVQPDADAAATQEPHAVPAVASASGEAEYSPSRPGYNFWDYISSDAVQEGRLCSSAANVNVVDIEPFDFNPPELQDHDDVAPSPFNFDLGTPPNEWDMYQSPGFLTWYQKELSMGNLDNVIYSDAFCASPPIEQSRAPGDAAAPPMLDVPSLLRLLEQAQDARTFAKEYNAAGPSSSPTLADPVTNVRSPCPAVYLQLLRDIFTPTAGDGDDQPQATTITLDNRDLNDIPTLLNVDNDDGTDALSTATTDDDDDEIDSNDIIRLFWSRDGDCREPLSSTTAI